MKNVSIEVKLYAVSAIVAAALVMIAALTWHRSQSINELNQEMEEILLIHASLYELNKIHGDFITHFDPKFLDDFRSEYDDLNGKIGHISNHLVLYGLDTTLVGGLSDEFSNYNTLFETIAVFQQKIGKDQTEGIRKKMRDSLYAMEAVLGEISDENVRYAIHRRMLMTQRPEKDLMLRRQTKYLAKFDNNYGLMMADVDRLITGQDLKTRLRAASEKYRGFFKQLSEAALRVGLTYEDGLRGEIYVVINNAHDAVSELSGFMRTAISSKEKQINIMIAGLLAAFSAVILALVFFLTRSVIRPLKEMTGVMTALSSGQYDVKIPGKSRRDEIGEMAKSVHVFKRNIMERDRARKALQTAHDELEERIGERTRDLQKEVAEREIAQRQAETANITKNEFLATMSHELRTPLNAIIGFSDIIRNETLGPLANDKYKEYVIDIHRSGCHLLELINDILDVSAVEAGKMELHEDDLDVAKVVERSTRMIRPRADRRNVDISVSIQDGLPKLHADSRRLRQILLNLLSNAAKFSHNGATVSLDVRLNGGGSMIFTVSDTGIGMNEQELAKALEPFGQVESTYVKKYEGTGLGLPLTKSLTELHGGTFEIDSEKGAGTRITIAFKPERVVMDY